MGSSALWTEFLSEFVLFVVPRFLATSPAISLDGLRHLFRVFLTEERTRDVVARRAFDGRNVESQRLALPFLRRSLPHRDTNAQEQERENPQSRPATREIRH